MSILASQQLTVGQSIELTNVVTGRELNIAVSGGPVEVATLNGTDTNPIIEGVLTDETAELKNPAIKTLIITATTGTAHVTVSAWGAK